MKVIINTEGAEPKTLYVNWRYAHKKKTVETFCTIFEGEKIIAQSKTYVHKGDVFVKAIGRKTALTKALKAFSFTSKPVRTQIWDAYKTMVKGKL